MPSNYEYRGNIKMKLILRSEYRSLKANYAEIHNDIKYFLTESTKASDIEISKRFAKAAIVFTAFYVESLANLLVDRIRSVFDSCPDFKKFIKKECHWPKIIDHWPQPLRIFFGAYIKIQNKNLSPENKTLLRDTIKIWSLYRGTAVIQDLFLIRNQVFAHPPARSTVGGTGVVPEKGLTQEGKDLKFNRFEHFPNIYTGFTSTHAHEIYEETKKFLEWYGTLIEKYPVGNELVNMFK
jgi:hypothetical protein